ncbi:MAG: hypothetical protein ACQESN_10430 [Thermotogota bacterium]
MKRTLVVLICLSFFINSGCKTLKTLEGELNPKSPEQKFQIKYKAWVKEKSDEVADKLNGLYPIARNSSIERLSGDEYEELKDVFSKIFKKFELNDDSFKDSLADLRKKYDKINYAKKTLEKTIVYINTQIEQAASDYREVFSSHYALYSVNKDHVEIVKESFYTDYPKYSKYEAWLSSTEKELEKLSDQVSSYGLQKESEKIIETAQKNGCTKVSELNFWGNKLPLSQTVPYSGNEPDLSKIYDLSGFKVLQSAKDGILIRPAYQNSYNAQPIFVLTDKNYADGFKFNGGDQLVCYRGEMKKYVSLMGGRKNVYQFKAINDSNKYYFLPLGN